MSEIETTAIACRLAHSVGLGDDDGFLLAVAAALRDLGADARRAEIVEAAAVRRIRELAAERGRAEAEGRKVGAAEERQRIAAILSAKEAEGRREVAEALAFQSDLPASAAIAALRAAPQRRSVFDRAPAANPPADPATLDSALRASDAPGGLVILDGDGELALASEAPVFVQPAQPPGKAGGDPIATLWERTVAAINRESGAQAGAATAGTKAATG